MKHSSAGQFIGSLPGNAEKSNRLKRVFVDELMKKANPVWQVILGLSRYGGLRTLSLFAPRSRCLEPIRKPLAALALAAVF
jgi:hypothetical protein